MDYNWVMLSLYNITMSRIRSASTVSLYELDARGSIRGKICASRPAVHLTQSPLQWIPGVVPPGVNQSGREADHSPSPSAEVRKMQ